MLCQTGFAASCLPCSAEFPVEVTPLAQLGEVSLTCKLEVKKHWQMELLTDLWVSHAKNRGAFVLFPF